MQNCEHLDEVAGLFSEGEGRGEQLNEVDGRLSNEQARREAPHNNPINTMTPVVEEVAEAEDSAGGITTNLNETGMLRSTLNQTGRCEKKSTSIV